MKPLLALALIGCGLCFPAASQAMPPNQDGPLKLPVAHHLEKTTQIDLTGTLDWVKGGPDPVWDYGHFTGYQITVNGTAYHLTGISGKAGLLLGQRVRVKGVLTVTRGITGWRSNGKDPVPMIARIITEHRVAVTEIALVETVELQGKLEMHTWPGYPKTGDVPMITANGKSYVLRFGNLTALEKFAAKYDGKTIVIRGSQGPNLNFAVMCQPRFVGVPSIVVHEVEVVENGLVLKASDQQGGVVQVTEHWELRGKLIRAFSVPKSMGYKGLWCMVEVNGTSYWLDLGCHERLAHQLQGQTVLVTGTYGPRSLPAAPLVVHVHSLRQAGW